MEIRSALLTDFDVVARLLQSAELLTDDLDIELNNFVVAILDNQIWYRVENSTGTIG